jgi:pimeloyl-ACP methyl ester carboxylesterase
MLEGGHFIHAEKPTQVAQLVVQFLSDSINST